VVAGSARHRCLCDSGREPLRYFRFLGDLASHLHLAIDDEGRRHEHAVLAELLDVLNIQDFSIQTLLLYYVLNQVVELVAFGSTCA
jgi:hypothetical protein